MSSVDNRIVNMQFNNKQFVSGAEDSAQALDNLESSISNVSGSDGGLDELGSAADTVASRFGALQIAGVAALATIASEATHTALAVGQNLLSSITSTIFSAGAQRAIDIQQAKFQFRGLGLDVQEVMANALTAVQGTAFGLQEAATAATQFGGSGVKAGDDMTTALRAISGIAAQTGRSYSEIAGVMTGIAGVGKVTGQDLIQFGVRGLDVLGPLADQLGKTRAQIRQMVTDGQIDFKTFAKAMDTAFGKNATEANKTFTGALANMKAALSRIGAEIFTPMIKTAGDLFNLLTKKIDAVHSEINPLINAFSQFSRAFVGGIEGLIKAIDITAFMNDMIHGFRHIVKPFIAIFDALGDAWSQVFPDDGKNTGKTINNIANAFRILTLPLKFLAELIPHLIPVFVLFFSVLKVGYTIVSALVSILVDLGKKAADIGGAIISGLTEGLSADTLNAKIVELANGIIETIKNVLGIHSPAESMIEIGTNIIMGIIDGLQAAVGFLWTALGTLATGIIEGIGNALSHLSATDIAALLNAALVGGILLAIRGVIQTIGRFATSLEKISTTLTAPLDLMTQSLKVMQTQVRAELIKSIAIAVGILTLSIIALSLLDPKKAAIGLGFLASELALITATMITLSKFAAGGLDIAAVGVAILLISSSMLVLSAALAVLGNLDTETLAKGLTAMGIALGIMTAALFVLGKGPLSAGVAAAGAAMVLMASAMVVMAGAIAILGNMDMGTLAKGLVAMAIGLALFTAALYVLGDVGPLVAAAAAGIYIVASAMVVMAAAIFALGKMDMGTLAKGLVAMGVGLALMTASLFVLSAMGPAVLAAAAGIFIMSSAMLVMATALGVIGNLSLAQIATALVTVALGFALLLAAGYLAIGLAPGLLVLGATVLLLGAGLALAGAGLLAAATAFSIFASIGGAAVGVLITGFTALIALLPQLARQLAVSVVVFIETIAEMAPRLREAFGKIIKGMLGVIEDAIPHLKDLANKLIGALLDVVTKNIPKYGKLIQTLIETGLKILREGVPLYVRTGLAIIQGVLDGMADKIPKIVDSATDLIVRFIDALQKSGNRIINAGARAIINFLNGIADTIREKEPKIIEAGANIGSAIVEGLVQALKDGAGNVVDAALGLANDVKNTFTGPLGFIINSPSEVSIWWGEQIVAGLVQGIEHNTIRAVGAVIRMANAAVAAGSKAVARAQEEARKAQIAAEKKQARANILDRQAKEAEKVARQSPKNKELQDAAKKARQIADAAQKAADAAQKKADAQAQRVQNVQAFQDADQQGKGDILTDRANNLADKAVKKLAEANAAAQAAKKATGKERDKLRREAQKDAREADKLAKASKKARDEADEHYAKAVIARVKAINEARRADERAKAQQEKFDNATAEEQIAILEKQAETARKNAKAEQKKSEALVKTARKIADKNATRAQKLLDQAERLAQKAQDSADKADQAAQQASDIANQDSTGTGTPATLNVSNSILEDAASVIDRFTKSLQLATEFAQSSEPTVQFVQYNTSPAALDATTIYRQSKNLLSTAEIKMAESSAP